MKKYYVTTPIYYINDVPHIGHAYTTIVGDVLKRFYKSKLGKGKTFFQTGVDEHGAKIAEVAGLKNKSPKEFCDELVPKFQQTWKNLNINYDYFMRTSNKRHEKIVGDILTKIYNNKDIYKKSYDGLYCVGCEKLLKKSELAGGKCPDHKTTPKKMSEENYFFKLSKYQKKLINLIEKDRLQILPVERKNEILSKIKIGLDDISISRKEVTWGIPIPWDSAQTTYVWIDALINYFSGPKIGPKHDGWFPADVHLMAKDILWFHAVIWPALCLSAKLDLPKTIFAHGFFTVDGEKMSKTIGNVVNPDTWVKKYGADAVRYYLLSAFPFGQDGDVCEDELARKYTDELANQLGNLVNRVATLIQNSKLETKNLKKVVGEESLKINLNELDNYINNFQFDIALKEIFKAVHCANEFIEREKPWELSKQPEEYVQLQYVLVNLVRVINNIGACLESFLPETAQKIQKQFNKKDLKIKAEGSLFPKLEK